MLTYWIRCKGCRYSRGFGRAPLTARVKATAHALGRGHEIDVLESDLEKLTVTVCDTISPNVSDETLDTPPW